MMALLHFKLQNTEHRTSNTVIVRHSTYFRSFITIALMLHGFIARNLTAAPVNEPRDANIAVAIRALMTAQEAAWNRGDIDGFMNGYARVRATVFVSGDTVTRGWQTVRDRYKNKYASAAQMGRLSFSDVEISELCSDTAIVLGRWQLKRKGDHPRGRFTLLFRHRPEGWRIVQDHTSAAAPP
jgi:ketosteroid isomerase-like protein